MSRWRAYYTGPYQTFREVAEERIPKQLAKHKPYTGWIRVCVSVRPQRPANTKLAYPGPDWDNFAKAVCDALNGRLWVDDKFIQKGSTSKRWAKRGDKGWFRVTVYPVKGKA